MIPPSRKVNRKPIEKSVGTVNSIDPRQSVKVQLKIFTPVGMAMRNVPSMKKTRSA